MFLDHTQRRSTVGRTPLAARLLRSWVRIPPGTWIFVCCECRVLSGRGLCDELITRPEESYRLWCVVACDLENLKNKEAMAHLGSQRQSNKKKVVIILPTCFCNNVNYVTVIWKRNLIRIGTLPTRHTRHVYVFETC